MKAGAFAYARASSLAEVFDLFERYGGEAKILAGGQSLIAALNMRLATPALLIDINGLPDLAGVVVSGESVRIGALTRHRSVERSAEIARHLPLIHQAMPHVAHAAIRNRGTFGGSIAYADPAAELPACSVALDATFRIAGKSGERRVRARQFFKGLYETDMRAGEVLLGGEFRALQPGYRSAFLELTRRHGDYAIAGVAAHGKFKGGRFADVRLAFFGIGAMPVLAVSAGEALEGNRYAPDTVAAVQSAVSADLQAGASGDLYHGAATKLHLARVLAGRAVHALTGA
ncbi:MAG: xanthine dehydrogenase family protein subunit M [Betaproteobacteria bacterium]|nr:xanthine dehydrogenase family protein subunit M [Betaproteobacteria bacterium]MBI3056425.1 xanthine dehydrogenase family protein subunit M [Betaproteobacteria bacterium]